MWCGSCTLRKKVLICPKKRPCQANEGRYKPSARALGSGRSSCTWKRRSWYRGQRPSRTTMETHSTLLHRTRSISGGRGILWDQLIAKMMTSANSTRVKAPETPAAGTPSVQVADLTAVGQSSMRGIGVPSVLMDLIIDLHTATSVRVRLAGCLSEPSTTTSVVRRGCVLAPALFPNILGPSQTTLGAKSVQNLESTSDNVKLRSRLSPERMEISKIGKTCD